MVDERKKVYTLHVRVQPFFYKWLKDLEEKGEYGNISDIVRMAIWRLKEQLEKERFEHDRRADRLIRILKEDPELRKKVLEGLEEGKDVS
jgi:Arc/MetJ-type ribon-helix-helix transcriptional regulator